MFCGNDSPSWLGFSSYTSANLNRMHSELALDDFEGVTHLQKHQIFTDFSPVKKVIQRLRKCLKFD